MQRAGHPSKRTNKKGGGNPNLVKGVVLNPNGRPKGSLNKYTLLSREMMTEKGPEIVNKIMEMAMDGDVHCLKMCIDRILPVHKAIDPNRAKQDSKIIINVGASDSIKAKIANTDPVQLINPETKGDDELIIEVGEIVD
jgi:hypothetical protein